MISPFSLVFLLTVPSFSFITNACSEIKPLLSDSKSNTRSELLTTVYKRRQLKKASPLISVKLVGTVTLKSCSQPEKALYPIIFIPSLSFKTASDSQSIKTQSLTFSSEDGSVSSVIELQE